MDKTKHRTIDYLQGEIQACLAVNQTQFRNMSCLEPEEAFYETEMAKDKIDMDLPIQLGYFILQYAKLRMLAFNYDFLDVYVDRSDYMLLEMDTDSNYMCPSADSFDDVIRPELRQRYQREIHGFCTDRDPDLQWLPRRCCAKHAKYDKRTPGIFKTEYEGEEMIGLCSKTYIVSKTKIVRPSGAIVAAHRLIRLAKRLKPKRLRSRPRKVTEFKFSSKGVSKRYVAPLTTFRHVLRTQVPGSGTNRGFRARDNTIFTYTQERRGFSYFYCKRKVLED